MTIELSTILNRAPNVLVADDDPNIRDLLAAYLTSSGCAVATAPDGTTAWKIIQDKKIDLAVLDLQMPGMTGLETCRLIKSTPFTRWIPVMIVTAHDNDAERLNAIEAGADEFLGKPFNAIILLTRARSLLRLRQLHIDLEERNALLRKVLHRYVDEDVAESILTDPEKKLKLGGETRLVTVLFADLKGFTRFTETHSATETVDFLNKVFAELTPIIFQCYGTFDKFIGDAVMAFYGAPFSAPDDAARALSSARQMRALFPKLMERMGVPGGSLSLSIGLHTGEAVVGNIGSERVMDYTVVGDTVNIAQRLQQAAGPGEIWMSERTYRESGSSEGELLGDRTLPGRTEPVRVYRIS